MRLPRQHRDELGAGSVNQPTSEVDPEVFTLAEGEGELREVATAVELRGNLPRDEGEDLVLLTHAAIPATRKLVVG